MDLDPSSQLIVRGVATGDLRLEDLDFQDPTSAALWKLRKASYYSTLDAKWQEAVVRRAEAVALVWALQGADCTDKWEAWVQACQDHCALFWCESPVEQTAILDSLADQWKAIYGDPDDPDVAAKIQRTVDLLEGLD